MKAKLPLILLAMLLALAWPASALAYVHTWYVATTGVDTNAGTQASPFLTPAKAASVATSGDLISLGAGVFPSNSASLVIPDGVDMTGAGAGATQITSALAGQTGGVIVRPGTGSTISNLRISATLRNNTYQFPVGFAYSVVAAAPASFSLVNVTVDGDSDGLYLQGDNTNLIFPTCDVYCQNCTFNCLYDSGAVLCDNVFVLCVNCTFATIGPTTITASTQARAINCAAGRLVMIGGSLSVANPATGRTRSTALWVHDATNGGTGGGAIQAELFGVTLSSSASSGPVLDLECNSGKLLLDGHCTYNAGKTTGTLGVAPSKVPVTAGSAAKAAGNVSTPGSVPKAGGNVRSK